jgi:hypothetical protein
MLGLAGVVVVGKASAQRKVEHAAVAEPHGATAGDEKPRRHGMI